MTAPRETDECDVCLRPKPPNLADEPRFDGWRLVDIEKEVGRGRLCCLGRARVRELEALIRRAIESRWVR